MPKLEGSGRKQGSGWLEVTRIEKTCKVKCKHCGVELTAKIERIRAHLMKCKQRSSGRDNDSAKSQNLDSSVSSLSSASHDASIDLTDMISTDSALSQTGSAQNHQVSPSSCDCSASVPSSSGSKSGSSSRASSSPIYTADMHSPYRPSLSSAATKKIRLVQQNLFGFTTRTTDVQSKEIDMHIATFFYSNSIAFRAADSNEYKRMMKSLRPGYAPPSRKDLAGRLLDEVHSKVEENMKADLREATITLLQDGWSSVQNDPIIATSIHTGKHSYLLSTHDCGSEKKTAQFCSTLASTTIEQVKKIYGKDVSIFLI